MPRGWTWLAMLVITVAAVALVDAISAPAPASADAGQSLTEPVPPPTNKSRLGTTRDRIAWFHAQERYDREMPVGRGIVVGQVEAVAQGGYLANPNHPDTPGTRFIPESGPPLLSVHATTVASHAFGPDSAGQGVNQVHGWQANHWLGKGYLNLGSTEPPRADHPARILNHSWIAPRAQAGPLILRRVDYLIDKQDVVVVCGVNNEPGNIPDLLASAYNVISVGVLTGKNSDGLTTTDGKGRCKPELVAPGNLTSYATGVVTGCVAALLELADRKIEQGKEEQVGEPGVGVNKDKDAARSEVIKAVLLAGAFRPGRWAPPEGEPLDRKLGAGVVDLDRSLLILDSGHAEPDKETNQRYGWSFAQVDAEQTRELRFTVDVRQGDSSFALVWHRRVLGGTIDVKNPDTEETRTVWNASHYTPNLDLSLFRVTPNGREREVAVSSSKVDNIELIHMRTLPPGTYALRVTRAADETDMPWDYAMAWRIEAQVKR